jgi:hypothetical protein
MKFSKQRAIRVIKRLSIEPTKKSLAVVPRVSVKVDSNETTAGLVGNWILERQKNRRAEAVLSNKKVLGWTTS